MRRHAPFLRQQQALADTELVLLVDHYEAEVPVGDRLLKDRVGADDHIDRAIEHPHEDRFARAALVAPGEQRDVDASDTGHGAQGVEMLAREDLGRGEHRRLRAGPTATSIASSATTVLPEPTSP